MHKAIFRNTVTNNRVLLAWACFVISQGTIAISYLIALQFMHEKVEACNPFFQGCLNITDAGIYSPEGYWFRGGMIAACAFFIMWWMSSYQHIKHSLTLSSKRNTLATVMGIVGAICLIVATAVLIPPRDAINWPVHVAGAVSFFLITFAAQAMHLWLVEQYKKPLAISQGSLLTKRICIAVQGLMIAVVLVLKYLDTGGDIGNAIEWWLALLIAIYFLSSAWEWKTATPQKTH